MKSNERHKLKENEFARTVAHARDVVGTAAARHHRRLWSSPLSRSPPWADTHGGGSRATRRPTRRWPPRSRCTKRRSCRLPRPTPGSAPPLPQPGTFQTQQAKLEAALPKFIEAADKYPNSERGYHRALSRRRHPRDARAPRRRRTAVQGSVGPRRRRASTDGRPSSGSQNRSSRRASSIRPSPSTPSLSRDTASQIPLDSVLMQLGRAYVRAGKKEEAIRAFNRIVEEFPQSPTCRTRGRNWRKRRTTPNS